jgi:ATP-dependent exoDNAse (exonuclease V) beta subunit
VIDLIFGDGDSWTIVDFKTDAQTDDPLERYRPQALWYVHAAQLLLHGNARAVLLSV